MGLALFYIAAFVSIAAGVGVVTARNIVYAALFLLAALMGVAGVFVLLFAEFLALVQVLIYGGAITIVILFALMLTRTGDYEAASEHRRWPFAALLSAGLFVLMVTVFTLDADRFNTVERARLEFRELGVTLFEQWAIPFEIASLILLVALVGAVIIGRTSREEDETLPGEERQ